MSKLICIGACAGAFGVKGEVKIKSFTDNPKDVFSYGPFRNDQGDIILTVLSKRTIKNGFAARCEQVSTREQAEALKSTKLYVERGAMPDVQTDEFYHEDLIGLRAELEDGTHMGRIKAVHDFGAGPLIEIGGGTDSSGKPIASFFHPFTNKAVPRVDIQAQAVTIVIEEPEVVTPDSSGDNG